MKKRPTSLCSCPRTVEISIDSTSFNLSVIHGVVALPVFLNTVFQIKFVRLRFSKICHLDAMYRFLPNIVS
jgi:hypothetical protein